MPKEPIKHIVYIYSQILIIEKILKWDFEK
jgi:hypothetical protein